RKGKGGRPLRALDGQAELNRRSWNKRGSGVNSEGRSRQERGSGWKSGIARSATGDDHSRGGSGQNCRNAANRGSIQGIGDVVSQGYDKTYVFAGIDVAIRAAIDGGHATQAQRCSWARSGELLEKHIGRGHGGRGLSIGKADRRGSGVCGKEG